MKIAVTSASGQLGSAIVAALIKEIGREHVIAIARTPQKAEHLAVEIRQGDYNHMKDFETALQGVDTVLLISGMDEPAKRIEQHRNVIEAAKRSGVAKIVYTSIIGAEENNAFSPIVKSNRQTEQDIRASGLKWSIGRNGIYIEPDLEYLDHYVLAGKISNCASDGKCAYTSREELAHAYAQMLLHDKHNGNIYNLSGASISQTELAENINEVFGTKLKYESMSVLDYQKERQDALGDFIGTIIAGIYEGIRNGANEVPSDYLKVAGRPHQSPQLMMENYRRNSPNQ